jgi:hypothetical protein
LPQRNSNKIDFLIKFAQRMNEIIYILLQEYVRYGIFCLYYSKKTNKLIDRKCPFYNEVNEKEAEEAIN